MKKRALIVIVATLGAAAAGVAIAVVALDTGTGDDQPSKASGSSGKAPTSVATQPAQNASAQRPVPTESSQPQGPRFAILEVRRGAHVPLRASPGGALVKSLSANSEFGSPQVLGVARRRGPWLGVITPLRPNGKLGWVRFDTARLWLYWTRYSLQARLSERILELRYGRRVLDRYRITVGAPGSDTPKGRFAITDALNFGHSPYYGCCALALSGHQENLPPGWIGGDRIAIHGTPGPVGEAASHGCIRATDHAMRALFRRVPLGTPVFVRG
jgi:L,D-transpeptidase catalytic domain